MNTDHPATYADTRRTVPGATVMRGWGGGGEGVIEWFSRMQKVVAAGSFESRYVALVEIVNGFSFLPQVKDLVAHPIGHEHRDSWGKRGSHQDDD